MQQKEKSIKDRGAAKSKRVFSLIRMIDLVLMFVPFVCCWYLYYEGRAKTVGSKQVSVLLFFVFILVCYYFCYRLDCYRVGILPIREIIFSHFLAVTITDVCMYILIWMVSIHRPKLIPGLLCLLVQTVIASVWSVVMKRVYFLTHTPCSTAIIYDVRDDMDVLIPEYGLDNKFKVDQILTTDEIIGNLNMLDGREAVFLSGIHSKERNVILKYCMLQGIEIYAIPSVSDVMMSGAQRMHMMHLPILRCQQFNPKVEYRIVKRLIDLIVALIAFVLLSPVFIATAIAVKSDGGPALYKQKRLTENGRVFEILKFRSMCVDAEKYTGAVLSAGENDPRITSVGRYIRACRLDELPQLINILKGDMSIVGPRPERPEIAARIQKEMPEFELRLQVKAGLTGYAQVYGKYNTTFYDKLLMDMMYIASPSILEDLAIMVATVKILLSKESTEGVDQDPSVTRKMKKE